jgi:hypothetical protein
MEEPGRYYAMENIDCVTAAPLPRHLSHQWTQLLVTGNQRGGEAGCCHRQQESRGNPSGAYGRHETVDGSGQAHDTHGHQHDE